MATVSASQQAEPYKGLRPYQEKDQNNFFGRDAERKVLIDKILANRLTLLFAASGVGKSSLLQAAVLPLLKDPGRENLDPVYYNDWVTSPLIDLKQTVLTTLKNRQRLDSDSLPEGLEELPLKDFFAFCALFTRQPMVVMLDQFEEFFQYRRYKPDFKEFIRQLAAAITDRDTPIAVVISMREDFALELNAFKPALPTLWFENFFRLERLTKQNARTAIVAPVERLGFRYEPKLLDELLKDLAAREQGSPSAMPVVQLTDTVEPAYLQIICTQLWGFEKNNPDKILRFETYRDKGTAKELLKAYVENVIGHFSAKEKQLASWAFDHLITRRGTKMAFTAGDLAQLLRVDAEALGKVLDRPEENRILRRQSRQGVFWYELYHDLFSATVEQWNEAYKTKQRNRRAVKLAGFLVLAGFALYGAYDVVINLASHHLRLSVKKSISDSVELYQGKAGSRDLLNLQHYIAETGYRWAQLEPDKLFRENRWGIMGSWL
jgi:hypothetical protein